MTWLCNECFPQTIGRYSHRRRGVAYDTPEHSKRKCFLENLTLFEFLAFWAIFILLAISIIYATLIIHIYKKNAEEYEAITNKSYRYICKARPRTEANWTRRTKFKNKYALGERPQSNAQPLNDSDIFNRIKRLANYSISGTAFKFSQTPSSLVLLSKERNQQQINLLPKSDFIVISRNSQRSPLLQSLVNMNPVVDNIRNITYDCQGIIISPKLILTTQACADSDQRVLKIENVALEIEEMKSSLQMERPPKVDSMYPLLIMESDNNVMILETSLYIADEDFVSLPYHYFKVPVFGTLKIGYHFREHRDSFRFIEVDVVHPYYCQLSYQALNYTIDKNYAICVVDPSNAPKACTKDLLGSALVKNGMVLGIYPRPNIESCGTYEKPYVFNSLLTFVPWLKNNIIEI